MKLRIFERKVKADLILKLIEKQAGLHMASFDTKLADVQMKYQHILTLLEEINRKLAL